MWNDFALPFPKQSTWQVWFGTFTALGLYLALTFLNASNKIMMALVCGCVVWFWLWLRSLNWAVFLSYVTSFSIQDGKSYFINLIEPSAFGNTSLATGFYLTYIIQPRHLLAAVLVILLLKDLSQARTTAPRPLLISLLLLVTSLLLMGISSVFYSFNYEVSLLMWLQYAQVPIVLFWALTQWPAVKKLVWTMIGVLSGQNLYQALLFGLQFLKQSSLGLNIESNAGNNILERNFEEALVAFRPYGTFGHANVIAGITLLLLPTLLAVAYYHRSKLQMISVIGGIVMIVLSYGRSAWIATLLIMAVMWWWIRKHHLFEPAKIKKYRWLLLATAIGLLFLVLPRLQTSLSIFSEGAGGTFRLKQFQEAGFGIMRFPLFGVGLGLSTFYNFYYVPNTTIQQLPQEIHNGYLLLALETGVPAMLALVASVWYLLRWVIISALTQPKLQLWQRTLALAAGLGVTAGLVNALFQPILIRINEPFFELYLVILLIGFAVLHYDKHQPQKL